MKKTVLKFWLFLILGLTTTVFYSCKKEDSKSSGSSLVGEWDWSAQHVTFTFTSDNKWSVHDYKYDSDRDSGTYTYDENAGTINLTYVPATNEPIWGRRWELRNDISSTLEVEAYDGNNYLGIMTLTKNK